MNGPQKVLIIGGGFAGLSCAQSLANNPRFQVTLIDRENHHLFQPLLYQVATTSLAATDIARSLRGIVVKEENISILLDSMSSIDLTKKIARSENHEYEFDYLVIACGAKTSYFGNNQWAEHTIGLKSLDDAQRIRAKVLRGLERAEVTDDLAERRRLMTILIVGGGPTGVELAGAFSDLVRRAIRADFRNIDPAELNIILVQSGDRILKPFEPELSEYARQRLQDLGVTVLLGPRVDEIQPKRAHLNKKSSSPLVTSDGWIEAETMIWAAGVEADPITRQLGIETDRAGRIPVAPDLSIPGHPDCFAAGDIVDLVDTNGLQVPGLAPAANQMGKHIGMLLKKGTTSPERRESFAYRDKGAMAIIGKNSAIMQTETMRLKGFGAWVAWLMIHLAFLVSFRSKLFVLLQWAFAYVVNKPGGRVFSNNPEKPTP